MNIYIIFIIPSLTTKHKIIGKLKMQKRKQTSNLKKHPRRSEQALPIATIPPAPLQLIDDAGMQPDRHMQFAPAHTEAERATLEQREELMTLLREKDQLFFEFNNYVMTLFLTHGVIPLLDDSDTFAQKMDKLFLACLEMLLPGGLSWVARNGALSHILLLITLYLICSAAIYTISYVVTMGNAYLTGGKRRSYSAHTALANEMVSQSEIKHHLTIARKGVEKNKYLLEFTHGALLTLLVMISKSAKLLSVIDIIRNRKFNFNSALYVSPLAMSFYRSYQHIRRGQLIDAKLQQDNKQLHFLKSLIKKLPIQCAIFTPVYQFTSFFSLTIDDDPNVILDEGKLLLSASQLLNEIELALTQHAHFTIRERSKKSLIIEPQAIPNLDQLLTETRDFLLARLRQILLHKEYVRENLHLLQTLSAPFSYRNWFWFEYDDENLIPIVEFRFDGDKLTDEARDAILSTLKRIYPPLQVNCDEEDMVIKGCIPILAEHKNAAKAMIPELNIIAAKINEVERAEFIPVAEQSAASAVELQPIAVVCQKAKKEKRRGGFLSIFNRPAVPHNDQSIPAEVSFAVGRREYVYHRGDENNTPPGPVVLLHANNMKPGRKFYVTDEAIAQEFPNTTLFDEYRKVAQKGNVVNSYSQQGHVRRAVYYHDVHDQRHISDYQVSLPGQTGVINVSLAAMVRTEDKVLRKLYVGNHYDPHPVLPKTR